MFTDDYIAERSGMQRAEMIRERILATIERIAYGPGIGAVRAFKKLTQDCRTFPESPWVIVYRPLPTLDGIEVVRVVDSRRDLRKIL